VSTHDRALLLTSHDTRTTRIPVSSHSIKGPIEATDHNIRIISLKLHV
jgi:hypothetical protein